MLIAATPSPHQQNIEEKQKLNGKNANFKSRNIIPLDWFLQWWYKMRKIYGKIGELMLNKKHTKIGFKQICSLYFVLFRAFVV